MSASPSPPSTAQAAAAIAHELNSRLSVILGESDLAMMEENLPPVVRDCLQKIQASATDAGFLTANLLRASGRNPIQKIPGRISDLLQSLLPSLQQSIGTDHPIRLNLDDPLPRTFLDPAEIQEMLRQLCLNAAEASPSGETIRITVTSPNSALLRIEISDTGSGIPDEFISAPHLPFHTSKPHHLGIGLAVAEQITRQHKGTLICERKTGRGTLITIEIPSANS